MSPRRVPSRGLRPGVVALVLVASGLSCVLVGSTDVLVGSTAAMRSASERRDSVSTVVDSSGFLVFSEDGEFFRERAVLDLFEGQVWVPGDRRRVRFWIRNDAPDPGDVSARLVLGRADTLAWVNGFSVRLRGRVDGRRLGSDLTPSRRSRRPRSSGVVPLVNHLRPGRRTRVVVVAALASSAGNRTMRRVGDMSLRLHMALDPDSRAGRGERSHQLPRRSRG